MAELLTSLVFIIKPCWSAAFTSSATKSGLCVKVMKLLMKLGTGLPNDDGDDPR